MLHERSGFKLDNKRTSLKLEIKSLEENIAKGRYEGENLLMARDMLKTKKDELAGLEAKIAKPVANAPIKGLTKKTTKNIAQMSGGARV